MVPSFGAKKAQPAFQVKAAAPAPPVALSTPASSSASLNSAATPAHSSLAASSKAPPAAVLPPQDSEAGVCSSDEDFEKENILIDPKSKKPPTKSKKLKVKKDPDAPKKAATSYLFFCKQVSSTISVHQSPILCCVQERQNVMNELGNIGFTATGAELARR